jgi:hypothetical protein
LKREIIGAVVGKVEIRLELSPIQELETRYHQERREMKWIEAREAQNEEITQVNGPLS